MRSENSTLLKWLAPAALVMFSLMAESAQAQSAASAESGLSLSAQLGCQGCHGQDGNMMLEADYPKLGGQHYDYLVVALQAYRSGERDHAIMSSFARDLSDQQIRDLSAWYASQSGLGDWDVRPQRRRGRGAGRTPSDP
jgi:cytochrome c553